MKRLLLKYDFHFNILLVSILIYSCSEPGGSVTHIKNIPEEISSHFVFSKTNNRLFYSSNKKNIFHIYELELKEKLGEPVKLQTGLNQDVFVRSVSQDGNYLSFVSDKNGNQIYDVFLYKLKDQKTFNLTRTLNIDDGEPKFSPKRNILAFLSSGKLKLFDVEQMRILHISEKAFKNFDWGESGDIIFLEDNDSNIWMMEFNNFEYNKIWSSPSKSYVPKMFNNKNEILLFISDHSEVSNIYKLNILSREIEDSINFERDLYSPNLKTDKTVEFRMNTKGSILNYTLNSNGVLHKTTSQESGVSYQYYSNDSLQINLFAGVRMPKHFLIGGRSYIKELEEPELMVSYSKIKAFKNEKGVYHYLFLPKNQKIKGWIVWLHGGPHEQISPRYNVYMNFLNRNGWGIIALNYKGSTGMGNDFEMRDITDPDLRLAQQITDVRTSLEFIRRKSKIKNEKFVLLGVSYGGKLAHSYLKEYPNSVSKIIDFSGLPIFYNPSDFNQYTKDFLFISGENDFALNISKEKLMKNYGKQSSVELLILKNEGHYIRRKNNIIKSLNKIIDFLEN